MEPTGQMEGGSAASRVTSWTCVQRQQLPDQAVREAAGSRVQPEGYVRLSMLYNKQRETCFGGEAKEPGSSDSPPLESPSSCKGLPRLRSGCETLRLCPWTLASHSATRLSRDSLSGKAETDSNRQTDRTAGLFFLISRVSRKQPPNQQLPTLGPKLHSRR